MNFLNELKKRYHQSLSNPGTKIKGYAKTLNFIYFLVMIISIVIWAFAGIGACRVYHYSYYGGGYTSFNFLMYLAGFLGIVCSYAALYITCVFLAAFGELVENSTTLVDIKASELSRQAYVDMQQIDSIVSETLGE